MAQETNEGSSNPQPVAGVEVWAGFNGSTIDRIEKLQAKFNVNSLEDVLAKCILLAEEISGLSPDGLFMFKMGSEDHVIDLKGDDRRWPTSL
jgi:hypothetical protein